MSVTCAGALVLVLVAGPSFACGSADPDRADIALTPSKATAEAAFEGVLEASKLTNRLAFYPGVTGTWFQLHVHTWDGPHAFDLAAADSNDLARLALLDAELAVYVPRAGDRYSAAEWEAIKRAQGPNPPLGAAPLDPNLPRPGDLHRRGTNGHEIRPVPSPRKTIGMLVLFAGTQRALGVPIVADPYDDRAWYVVATGELGDVGYYVLGDRAMRILRAVTRRIEDVGTRPGRRFEE